MEKMGATIYQPTSHFFVLQNPVKTPRIMSAGEPFFKYMKENFITVVFLRNGPTSLTIL